MEKMSSCQKLENTSSIIVLELEFKQEKSSHQNQDLAGIMNKQLFSSLWNNICAYIWEKMEK